MYTYVEISIALEDFDRRGLGRVENIPVIDSRISDQTKGGVAYPLPEKDILIHGSRLQLGLLLEVEDLQRPRLGSKSNDLLSPVHDGTVGLDWSAGNIIAVL